VHLLCRLCPHEAERRLSQLRWQSHAAPNPAGEQAGQQSRLKRARLPSGRLWGGTRESGM